LLFSRYFPFRQSSSFYNRMCLAESPTPPKLQLAINYHHE